MLTDPRAVIRFVRLGLVLAAGVVIAGCCSDTVGRVTAYGPYGPLPTTVWVGDTGVMEAEATRGNYNWLCLMPLYTTETQPDLFSYSSSNPSVITVSSRGVIRATAVGKADLTAMTAGVTSTPQEYLVIRPIAEIRITATPAAPQVGDTITIRATPVDAAGATISDATLFPFTTLGPSGQLGSWLLGGSPTLAKFYATGAGDLRVVSSSHHGFPYPVPELPAGELFTPRSLFADTLTVTIAPRLVIQTQRTGRD
jgi:hypothetical protein